MSYSCSDFVDTILDALDVDLDAYNEENPDDDVYDTPSIQADLCLEEIERLKKIERAYLLLTNPVQE